MLNIAHVHRIVLGVLLLGLGHAAYARDYAVELIIFERSDASNESGEVWNVSSKRIAGKLQNMRDLAANAIDYPTLPELDTADSHYKTIPVLGNLAAIRSNLVTAGYRILYAANWIQPAATYRYAPLISFGSAGSSLPYAFVKVYKTSLIFADIHVQYSPTTPTEHITTNTVTATTNVGANDDLNSPDINPADTNLEPQPYFFISEKRRLKFEETHYFDHPQFGVIVGVWPSGQ